MTATDEISIDVTDDDVAFFDRNGYFVVERITTDDEVARLREVFDELFAPDSRAYFDVMRPPGAEGPPIFPQTIMPELQRPELGDTLYVRNARRVASRLLRIPEDELTHWGHMLDKPARRGFQAPWHQDEAYWEPHLTYHAVGAWMPLDDADVDNGCLWFLPGSHHGELLAHRHLGGDPLIHGLELIDPVDTSAAVPVPLRAGGASFHHPRTLHHSRPNVTDRPRRAYANEYQTPPQPRSKEFPRRD
jgi:ectoine hydroxylase-related dioxygenase (phytanoyl-CoA dioxygenase family)